jgi:Arm DNA-binding domain
VLCSIATATAIGSPKRHTKLTLGRFPTVSLAEARRRATAALRQVSEGIDPAVEKRKTAIEVTDRKRDTVQAWYERYTGHAKKRTRESTWAAIGGIFRREILRYGVARASTISSAAT